MFISKHNVTTTSALLAGLMFAAGPAAAATVELDGTTVQTLSDAVALAYADEPAIVNITTNDLTATADEQILLDKPIVINGDAENGGLGDGMQADILVDTATIADVNTLDLGENGKCYLQLQAPGEITINDIRIHPNSDGIATADEGVTGVRMGNPMATEPTTGTFTLANVFVSGSDADDNYIALDTGDEIFTGAAKKWGGTGPGWASIQLTKAPGSDETSGTYNAVLDHCHAGLSYSSALNIPNEGPGITSVVIGGLYGHCERDGIYISGTGVTLTGSQDDRLRVVRSTMVSGGNNHAVDVAASSQVDLIEYVDAAACNTGRGFQFDKCDVTEMRFCRALGKMPLVGGNPTNAAVYIAAGADVMNAHDNTFVGDDDGSAAPAGLRPFEAAGNFNGEINLTDTIFTSVNLGTIHDNNNNEIGIVRISNSAIPSDAVAGESLATPPVTDDDGVFDTIDLSDNISISPNYLLTLDDYDWSDTQGADDLANGAGNFNVLRPNLLLSPDYATAASGGTPLLGGAGPGPIAGIENWMLME